MNNESEAGAVDEKDFFVEGTGPETEVVPEWNIPRWYRRKMFRKLFGTTKFEMKLLTSNNEKIKNADMV